MRDNTIKDRGVPAHIAIIMDGNGRWAKRRLMPRSYGHKQGMERMIGLMEHAFEIGVDHITVYALSTENLNRPKEELEGLFDLVRKYFNEYMGRICARGVFLRILGDSTLLPQDIQRILKEAEENTRKYKDSGKSVNIAFCYGARDEIVRAVNLAVDRGEKVTQESFSQLLYTGEIPDPDLLIRTGKEIRLSNFLLYQAAYTELYFSKKMFPEFSNKDLDRAIAEYNGRTRRFGKTDEQVKK